LDLIVPWLLRDQLAPGGQVAPADQLGRGDRLRRKALGAPSHPSGRVDRKLLLQKLIQSRNTR
jgi:hypothetical protein